MLGCEHFSAYNNLPARDQGTSHPLADLLPDDRGHGWHVARNLIKPLNHLDFLRRKEEIALELNLHNTLTSPRCFDANYDVLLKHHVNKLSTTDVISYLARQSYQLSQPISESAIAQKLREYASVRHVEFHPSDLCNLACRDCTYGHDDPERKPLPIHFPFQGIEEISKMQPRSMVVIGGGEPTLYRDGTQRFEEMLQEVCRTIPNIVLALVTNGTTKPPGHWPSRFSWIRLSLDAGTERTYTDFRGRPLFRRVIKNFLSYLDHDVKYVGISFLFARSNINECATAAKFLFELVKKQKPQALHKVNIQYRPLRRDPYHADKPFHEAVTPEQIQHCVSEIRELADASRELKTFLRNQTNIPVILGGNTHPPHEFSRCHYSQTFRIIRANGDLRPCFIRVSEPDFLLGNILTDSLETIALNTLLIAARRKPHCDEHNCRQCHVNYTFEQGLNGKLEPSTSPEVLADPMF